MDYALRLLLTNALVAALLAAVALVVSRLVRRPAVAHALWLLALLKLVTPPLLPLALLPGWDGLSGGSTATPIVVRMPAPEPGAAAAAPNATLPVSATGERGTATRHRSEATRGAGEALAPARGLPWLAAAVLAAGALAVLGLAAWRFVRFRRLLAEAEPAPAGTAARAVALAARLGLARVPPLLLVRARIPPMLWPEPDGPRLLLPRELMRELTATETDALLAHELAHVQRRDHWVRLLELAATALFWWYPLTWWTRAALRRAEERCCDECVLRVLPRSAQAYANGLLKSLCFVSATPAAVPALASGASPLYELELRLKEILMSRPAPRLAPSLRLALLALACIGLAVFPTQAREDGPAPAAAPADAAQPAPRLRSTVPVLPAAPAPTAAPASPATPSPVATVPAPAQAPTAASPASPPAPAPAPPAPGADDTRRGLEQQRRALEAQRGELQQQQLQLQRRGLELEAKAEQLELRSAAASLRAAGRQREAELCEKRLEISERHLELQRRRLELDAERLAIETKLEAQQRARHDELADLDAARGADTRQALERARQRAEADRMRVEEQLASRQRATRSDAEALEKELRRLADDEQIHAASETAERMARAMAEQAEALEAALAALKADRTLPAEPADKTPQPRPRP